MARVNGVLPVPPTSTEPMHTTGTGMTAGGEDRSSRRRTAAAYATESGMMASLIRLGGRTSQNAGARRSVPIGRHGRIAMAMASAGSGRQSVAQSSTAMQEHELV